MLHLSLSRCVPSLALTVATCLALSGCAPGPTGLVGPTGSSQPPSPSPTVPPTPDVSPLVTAMPSGALPVFTTWERLELPEPLPHVYGGSHVAGAAPIGAGYVAVGAVDGGCCDAGFSTDSHGVVWRSEEGLAWALEPRAAVFDLAFLRGVAGDGHRLVAIGSTITDDAGEAAHHGAVWASNDGVTWQRRAVEPIFSAVVATGDGYLASAQGPDGPEIWTSSDGLGWSIAATSASLGPGEIRAMAVTPAGVVAIGSGSPRDASTLVAAAWRSADGRHWTRASAQPWFSNASMGALAVSGSTILAIGDDIATGSGWWLSRDGLTWTRVLDMPVAAGAASTFGVAATDHGFVVVGAIEGNIPGRAAWQSADGTSWSELATPADLGVDTLTGIQAGDDLIVFTRTFDFGLGRAVPQAWVVR